MSSRPEPLRTGNGENYKATIWNDGWCWQWRAETREGARVGKGRAASRRSAWFKAERAARAHKKRLADSRAPSVRWLP